MWGRFSFFLCPGVHKVLFVPSKSLHCPQLYGCPVIKYADLQTWRFPVPLPDPQVGKSKMGSRTFTTVLWYNSFPVCWSPTQQLCGMIPQSTVVLMVTSSKRTYANTPYFPRWLLPVPLSPWQATAAPCLHRRPLNTTGISGSVSCWGRMLLSLRS